MPYLKVLLCSSETVLDMGVSSVLAADGEFQLTIAPATDIQDFLSTSAELQPDVIIFEHNFLETQNGLLTGLLNSLDHSRVITIDQNLNLLYVYTRQGIQVQNASDLIKAIRLHFQTLFPGGDNYEF
jgi:hypothetical protein